MKAVIPAAGLGTRFLPATKAVPKELLPIYDKPAIQYVVEEALAAGASEVLVVTNDSKPAIEQHFSPDQALVGHLEQTGKPDLAAKVHLAGGYPVSFVTQSRPLGLGHAVWTAGGHLGSQPEPFFVLLGDCIVPENNMLQRMLAVSKAHGNASVIAVMPVPIDETRRYGVIAGSELDEPGAEEVWQVTGLVEKPASNPPSQLAVFGRYLLSPRIIGILEVTDPGHGGEIQLTDALLRLLDDEPIYAMVVSQSDGFDVGTIEGWILANVVLSGLPSLAIEA